MKAGKAIYLTGEGSHDAWAGRVMLYPVGRQVTARPVEIDDFAARTRIVFRQVGLPDL